MNQNNGKGMSIAALVCGILGVVLCWVPIASWVVLVLSILGIVFGANGHEEVQSYRSVSGTGNCRLVCGIVGAVFSLIGAICTTCAMCAYCTTYNSLSSIAYLY